MDWQEKWEPRPPGANEANTLRQRREAQEYRDALETARERVAALPHEVRAAHSHTGNGDCSCGARSTVNPGSEREYLQHVLNVSGALDEERAREDKARAEYEEQQRKWAEELREERRREAAAAKLAENGHAWPEYGQGAYTCECGEQIGGPDVYRDTAHRAHLYRLTEAT